VREAIGMLALNAVLAAPGVALLVALRLVRPRPASIALALGPALLLGVAMVVPLITAALALGLTVRLPAVLALIAVLTAALAAPAVRRSRRREATRVEATRPAHAEPPAVPWSRAQRVTAGLLAAGAGAYLALGASAASRTPILSDGASFWSLKALGLYHYGELTPEVFEADSIERAHHDYPLLQPILHSLVYRFAGRVDVGLGNAQSWLLLAAFLWTVMYLISRRGPALAAAFPLAAILASPAVAGPIQIGYADATVAAFCAAGVLGLGLWVERADARFLVLGVLLLGAGANTKNEGLGFAIAALAAAGLVVARGRRELLRPLAAGAGLMLATILPWRIWVAANHIASTDFPSLSRSLSPGYLFDRTDRLDRAFGRLVELLGDSGQWTWLVPAAAAICVAALLMGVLRRVAAFYVLAAVLSFATLLWAYWAGTTDIEFHLVTSASRTIVSLAFLAAAGAAHLLPALLERLGRVEDEQP
jgi:hypothetical protein